MFCYWMFRCLIELMDAESGWNNCWFNWKHIYPGGLIGLISFVFKSFFWFVCGGDAFDLDYFPRIHSHEHEHDHWPWPWKKILFMTTIMAIHIHGNDGHNLSKASKTHKVQNCDIRTVLHSYVFFFFIETDILYHADWNEYEKLKTSIEEEMFGWGNKVRHKEWDWCIIPTQRN